MTHYIEVVAAARDTVTKMLTQRTGQQSFKAYITTSGGRTAAAMRQGDFVKLDLPSLAPDTVLTRAEADRMVGYLVHEVCHMLHTDFAVWAQAVAEGPRVRHWTNALEDVRIEAHEMRVGPYKALRSVLSGLVSHLYAEAHTRQAEQGVTLGQGMLNAPYVFTILGRAANGYDLPTTRPLKDNLAPNVRKVIDMALGNVKACRSTEDCLRVARQLVALEKQLKAQEPPKPPQPKQPPQPPQPQPPEGDDGEGEDGGDDVRPGDDQEGDDQGEGEGEGDDLGSEEGEKDGPSGEGEGDQDPTDDDEGDHRGHGEGDEEGEKPEPGDQGDEGDEGKASQGDGAGGDYQEEEEDEASAIDPDLNLGDTAQNIMERTGDSANENDSAHRLNGMTCERRRARNMHSRDMKGAAEKLNAMSPQNGVLHGQIARLLVSEARNMVTHHETSGRMDRRALVRMKTGAPDVFSRRDHAPGIDTAVLVLVDLSGSMAGTIDLARVTAWALANAAESAGGKLAIAGFKGSTAQTELHYVKDWQQTCSQAAGALMSVVPNSATPLSASIVGGAQDLAEQAATRRILIVITDGQCDLGSSAVRSACALALDMGVEAVGIGMNCEVVIRAFPPRYSVNVANLNQLATTGLGTLSRMLEEGAPR